MNENNDNALFESFMQEMENIRDNWAQAHEDVEKLEFSGKAEDGKIEVVLNGKFQPTLVSFEQAIRGGVGIKGLENGIKDAISDAAKQAEQYFQNQIEAAVQKMESSADVEEETEAAPQDTTTSIIQPRLSKASSDMTVQ